MSTFAPRKSLSQNFLTDPRIAERIIDSASLQKGDHVFEIGPGTGMLTKRILTRPIERLVAVDLDPRSIDHAETQQWSSDPRLKMIIGDALAANIGKELQEADRDQRVVIGNIPYSITSDLLFWIFEQHHSVSRAVVMMQKEVAQRCLAKPRTKEYGILSVATWLYASALLVCHVRPGSFFPKPDVTSSVLRFDLRDDLPEGVDPSAFMSFVKGAFSQRRKVMKNSLADWAHRHRIELGGGVTVGGRDLALSRAEEFSPSELLQIYSSLRQLSVAEAEK